MTEWRPKPSVFVRRCFVCAAEIRTEWGPDVHAESKRALVEHLEQHTCAELQAFVMKRHFSVEEAA